MIDQEKIHNQCLSDDPEERRDALEKLRKFFSSIQDKQQAWNDFHRLTKDKISYVRSSAVSALVSAFSQMPDKQQAWNDLQKLTTDKDTKVRSNAAKALGFAFSHVPDKQQAWNDLIRLTNDEDSYVRSNAAYALGFAFSQVPDKKQAWSDLHRLTNDEDSYVRSNAAYALGSAFSHVPDKQQAWDDLHRLTNDEDSDVRREAAITLGSVFSQVPDKQQAWNDLLGLANDETKSVRSSVAVALGSVFSQVPDKQQAWNDLIRLITDENSYVRSSDGEALGSAFPHVPDKQQAWDDLHRLTNEKNNYVRSSAAKSLGSVFSQVPDKQQAWNDLHRLTNDKTWFVRYSAAKALGSAFSQVPDKQQAWNDLKKLTKDKDSDVRTSSNHSLGKVSIFKASQANKEEDYKKEFEKAICFFERASHECKYSTNPSKFCLPFYRSFHTIIFKKQEAKEEVDNYLAEAKNAIAGSKSKELLLEAVENLANALNEVQNLGNLDLEAKKGELDFYRKYCDRAAELMIDTEKVAPYATAAMRKGMPILNRYLKEIIEEIQEKAKVACWESRGTDAAGIIYEINKEIQTAINDDQRQYIEILEDIVYILKMKIPQIPENRFIFSKIEAIENKEISPEKYRDLPLIISNMNTMKVVSEQELDQKLDQKLQKFDLVFDEITYIKNKLSCISFDIFKIKLNSADVISNLKTMKEELEKLSKIEGLNTLSIEKLDSIQAEKLDGLNNNILERLDEIKILIFELSKDNDELYQEYSRRLDKLKQSKLDTLIQRYSAAISLISFVISGIQIAR